MEIIAAFIVWGQGMPVEVMWVVMMLASFGGMLFLQFLWGKVGLYMAILLAVLGANIQVLKVVSFNLLGGEPVALGTILFATTYLATDILCERYGKVAAMQGVMVGFCGFLVWTLWMNITIAFPPYVSATEDIVQAHEQISALFTVLPQFFVASMVAFLVSEFVDVWVFDALKKRMGGKKLWLRNNFSTVLSALIDNTVFSLLAWIILSDNPLPLQTVVVTYILGTFFLRVVVALFDTPIIYFGRILPVLAETKNNVNS